jgi:hypothetical protein
MLNAIVIADALPALWTVAFLLAAVAAVTAMAEAATSPIKRVASR